MRFQLHRLHALFADTRKIEKNNPYFSNIFEFVHNQHIAIDLTLFENPHFLLQSPQDYSSCIVGVQEVRADE